MIRVRADFNPAEASPMVTRWPMSGDAADWWKDGFRRLCDGSNPKKALDLPEVAKGLRAFHVNASELVEDARLLASKSRIARAAALAVLALEELGKIPDMFDTAVVAKVTGESDVWKQFWRRSVKHKSKQERIAAYGKLSAKLAVEDAPSTGTYFLPYAGFLPHEILDKIDVLKQRNFYVDFVNDRFVVPGEDQLSLSGVLDLLFFVAEERVDSFAHLYVPPGRALEFLNNATVHYQKLGAPENATDVLRAPHDEFCFSKPEGDSIPLTLRADLRSLLSDRSAPAFLNSTMGGVPDYKTFCLEAESLISEFGKDSVLRALKDECASLRCRLEIEALPGSARRAFFMLKLAVFFFDRCGENEAVKFAFGNKDAN